MELILDLLLPLWKQIIFISFVVVGCPGIDAEGEMPSRLHRHRSLL
jgi:hypothetical protein